MNPFQLFSLKEKVVLITGATSGIGIGMAEALAQFETKQVIYVYRSKKNAEELEKHLRAIAKDAGNEQVVLTGIEADLAQVKVNEVESKIYKKAIAESLTGKIDVLINNAGIAGRHPFEEYPDEEFSEVLHVNLLIVSKLSQLVGKHMIENNIKGKIIITCSLYSFEGGLMCVPYTISKGAVKSLVQGLSNEWAGKGICVNGIAPGIIKTQMNSWIGKNKEQTARLLKKIPSGYYGTADDFRGTVVFLCSSASDYITGQVVVVDGGYLASSS